MVEVVTCSATNKATVRLAGSLDIREANGLQSALNGLLSEGQNGAIDCTNLESIDTACLQLLLAAKRDTRGTVEILFDADSEITKWFDYAGTTERLKTSANSQTSTPEGVRS